jgi:hypothetical protein
MLGQIRAPLAERERRAQRSGKCSVCFLRGIIFLANVHFQTSILCAKSTSPQKISQTLPKMTAKLQSLEDVTRMVGSVVRILGGNPGKFTLQGVYAGIVNGLTVVHLVDNLYVLS